MTELSTLGGKVADNVLSILEQARDQAHRSGERATREATKLLSTVHAGVAITAVAWLQRLFERPEIGHFLRLAWHLDAAIVCNMLGLLMLGCAALIDLWTPRDLLESAKIGHVLLLRTLDPAAPTEGESSGVLKQRATDFEAHYSRWNTWSIYLGRGSLLMLAAAFAFVAWGVALTLPAPR